MRKIKQYEDYFEGLATRYLPIGHRVEKPQFATLSREKIMSQARNDLNLTEFTLVSIPFEPKLIDSGSRQFALNYVGAFEIVKDLSRNDLDKTLTQDEALEMCLELVAQMMTEHLDRNFALGNLKDSSIDFYPVDGNIDNCVGYGVEFTYTQGFSRKDNINPANWQ